MADVHIQMNVKHEVAVRIDIWREKQVIVPSRTVAIRYLLEKGLDFVQQESKKGRS